MCGIAGALFVDGSGPERAVNAVRLMQRALAHRGPDGEGVWHREASGSVAVALAHTRLAIIDLSEAGGQPMTSGRSAITCNGEVFNYRSLRRDLEALGEQFYSESDTEVVLRGHDRWGDDWLTRLDGMFAFAVWDERHRRLTLARDRLGIKPLYYARVGNGVVFASEVRALVASGLVRPILDRDALWHYLGHQTSPTPATLIEGVRMLAPGEALTVDANGTERSTTYWDLLDPGEDPASPDDVLGARADVRELLSAAVRSHLVSDVPVGVFLSGGIDSTALVSVMRSEGLQASTFSLAFEDQRFDESHHAREVARAFGTEHHELTVADADILDMLPEMLDAVDHPSGDGVNTYVVSKLAREAGLKVALSGLGGDELFGGYPSFRRLDQAMPVASAWGRAPDPIRRAAASALRRVGSGSVAAEKVAALAESDGRLESLWPITRQLFGDDERRSLLAPNWWPADGEADSYRSVLAQAYARYPEAPLWARVSYAEARAYMHDVLLRDTDQMSMAHGLEVRVPLLDHRLVRYVIGLSDAIKRSGTGAKALLVDSLERPLPAAVVDRPKQGFTMPFDLWMRGALRPLCERHLGPEGLAGRGFFARGAVEGLWVRFLQGSAGVTWSRIWTLVALDAWLERTGVTGGAA